MSEEKIWIGIPKKTVENVIKEEVEKYAKKLINYPHVKNIFYNELINFAKSKLNKKARITNE